MQSKYKTTLDQLYNSFISEIPRNICSIANDAQLTAKRSIHDDNLRFLPFQPLFGLLNSYAQKKGVETVDQLYHKIGCNSKDQMAYRLMRIIFDCHVLGEMGDADFKHHLTFFLQLLKDIGDNPQAISCQKKPSLSEVARHMAIYLKVLIVADTDKLDFLVLGANKAMLFQHFDALGGEDVANGSCWQGLFRQLHEKFQGHVVAPESDGFGSVVRSAVSRAPLFYKDPFEFYKVKIEAFILSFPAEDIAASVMLSLVDKVATHVERVVQKFSESHGELDVAQGAVAFEVISLFYLLDKAVGIFAQRTEQQSYMSHVTSVAKFATELRALLSFIRERLGSVWLDDSPYLAGIASIKAIFFSYLQSPKNHTCLLRQRYTDSLDDYLVSISNFLNAVRNVQDDETQGSLVLMNFIQRVEVLLIGSVGEGEALEKIGCVDLMHSPDNDGPKFEQCESIYKSLCITMSHFGMALGNWQEACDSSGVVGKVEGLIARVLKPLLKEANAKLCHVRDEFNDFRIANNLCSFEEVMLAQEVDNVFASHCDTALQGSDLLDKYTELLAKLDEVNNSFAASYRPGATIDSALAPGTPQGFGISQLWKTPPRSSRRAGSIDVGSGRSSFSQLWKTPPGPRNEAVTVSSFPLVPGGALQISGSEGSMLGHFPRMSNEQGNSF